MIVRITVPESLAQLYAAHHRNLVVRKPDGTHYLRFVVKDVFALHEMIGSTGAILLDVRDYRMPDFPGTEGLNRAAIYGVDSPQPSMLPSEARRDSRFESGGHEPGSDAPGTL